MTFMKMNGVSIRGNGVSYTSIEDTGLSVSSFRAKREEASRRDRERLVEMAKQERLAIEASQPIKFPVHHVESMRGLVISAAAPAPSMRAALGFG